MQGWEWLRAEGALEALFTRLDCAITGAGYLPMAGQIVDATLVSAPRQRNTEAEKARIKAGGKAAAIWPDKPAKARQKDIDARWTVKFSKGKPGLWHDRVVQRPAIHGISNTPSSPAIIARR